MGFSEVKLRRIRIGRGNSISEFDKNIIIVMTEKGESRGNIAKIVKCNKMTIYNWQKKLNLI